VESFRECLLLGKRKRQRQLIKLYLIMNEEERKRKSILYWIKKDKIKNEKGDPIEFKQHGFLLEPYADESKEIVLMKGAQEGVSTLAINREIQTQSI